MPFVAPIFRECVSRASHSPSHLNSWFFAGLLSTLQALQADILPEDLQNTMQTSSGHLAVVQGTGQLSILVLEQWSWHVEDL